MNILLTMAVIILSAGLLISFMSAGIRNTPVIIKERSTGEFIKEKVPGAFWLRWLYHTPYGKLGLEALVKRRFLSSWYGRQMDQPQSCSRIAPFVQELDIDMDESRRSITEFTNFNDFFTRRLKDNARPLGEGIVSPGDGRILVFDSQSSLNTFYIKGEAFTIDTLLEDSTLADQLRGGALVFLRLAPVDYHRFHFPFAARAEKARLIEGYCYSVSPLAVRKKIAIFQKNKRMVTRLLYNDAAGDQVQAVMVEIAATLVASVEQTYTPDTVVAKGQEKGMFRFGGSSIILLFPPNSVTLAEDLAANSREGYETRIVTGQTIGRFR